MFELIDKRARHVFLYAEALARQEDGDCVGAEELFGGLLHQSLAERSESSALRALDKVGIPGRAALLVFLALRGRRIIQPLTRQDAEALQSRGIDLDLLASGAWDAPAPTVAPKVRRKTWWHKPQPVRESEAGAGPRRLPFRRLDRHEGPRPVRRRPGPASRCGRGIAAASGSDDATVVAVRTPC